MTSSEMLHVSDTEKSIPEGESEAELQMRLMGNHIFTSAGTIKHLALIKPPICDKARHQKKALGSNCSYYIECNY